MPHHHSESEDVQILQEIVGSESSDRSLLLLLPNQQPKLLQGSDHLPVPIWAPLELTANQVFGWLKMTAE